MNLKQSLRGFMTILFIAIAVPMMMANKEGDAQGIVNPKYIIGDWYAQIRIPCDRHSEATVATEIL